MSNQQNIVLSLSQEEKDEFIRLLQDCHWHLFSMPWNFGGSDDTKTKIDLVGKILKSLHQTNVAP